MEKMLNQVAFAGSVRPGRLCFFSIAVLKEIFNEAAYFYNANDEQGQRQPPHV
jgi:hypothetical protein